MTKPLANALAILLCLCSLPSVQAQVAVPDSVLMQKKIVSYQYRSGPNNIYYNCGTHIYAIWPDFGRQIVEGPTQYRDYTLVATEGQYVPRGAGQTLTNEQTRVIVPEGYYGHYPSLGGGTQSGSGYSSGCGEIARKMQDLFGGAESRLNGAPFRITDWYAVFGVPDGTPIAGFEWEQTEGLAVEFDGRFPKSREVEESGKKEVVTYNWAFGDTTSGSGANPTHTYRRPGTYSAKLVVTDDDGDRDSLVQQVTVRGVVLEHFIAVPARVSVGDTLRVTAFITNVGSVAAEEVSASRSILRVPDFPERERSGTLDAKARALLPTGDTTYTNVGKGQTVTLFQEYLITDGAEEFVDGAWQSTPVDWKSVVLRVQGRDRDGLPAKVRDKCEEGLCDNVTRIELKPMDVDVLSTRIDGETTNVNAGLKRWTTPVFENGVFFHLVPPLSLEPECNSGCVDLEMTVTEADGTPVEGAVIELSRVLRNTRATPPSVVTPDQGGGVFCFETQCKKTLTLPPTDAEGKQKARFWVPGVTWPVEAFLTAKATKEGFSVAEYEHMVTIQPTLAEVGVRTASPSDADMFAISIASGLQQVANLPKWPQKVCTTMIDWAFKKDAGLAGLKIS
ncbi:MAG: PKD domain-containing protein, partial [Rhodothermales bacterium]|nr:PKD domain-containing protein [Rhodothermales bacterium]